MKAIGWTLACALVVLAIFSKNVSCGNVEIRKSVAEPKATYGRNSNVDYVRQLGNFFHRIFAHNETEGRAIEEKPRTFGHKRIQFMLMPMVYKMGVMMTMLTVLTIISLKGLLIGVILLVLKLSTFLANFYSGWQSQQHSSHGWLPQPIHVHVHNSQPYAHHQAYHAWDAAQGPGDEEQHYHQYG